VGGYIATLEKVKTMEARLFIPAHAAATEDIKNLAQLNIDKVLEIAEKIQHLCTEPKIFEDILQQLFKDYGLTMNFEQYALVGSTVRSYLSWLKETDRLEVSFEDSRLLWHKI
jgi:regulator of sirC expression with transglutaminase-like and TPR domain